ncbi:hypothetical protein VE25_08065 [Devosia geojensis]|uniref:DUF721 domain-containing protein n=1 Tax=Devosia geojensis TaxID=443610 RepID=A0A0F5FU08_9HYPH|nr:DciA family protein [Devosia geojensis]KKB12313.1 hypothetical protein VE25_08065 [Devosia geojensis]
MAKPESEPKRRNRTVGVAEALGRTLDPFLKKRGFASRDILDHWSAIAPAPYDAVTFPERLAWPRGEKSAEGATLYLRCAPGHALAAQHEGPRIAQAVNRYFGYLLVSDVRLSAEPFSPHSDARNHKDHKPSEATRTKIDGALAQVKDDDLRDALRALGHAVMGRSDNNKR